MKITDVKAVYPRWQNLQLRPGETVQSYGKVKRVDSKYGERGRLICSVGVKKQNGEDVINGEAHVATPD